MRPYALFAILVVAFGGSCGQEAVHLEVSDGPNPWTHLRFEEGSEDFQFAIVSDRTGARRPGVFPGAVERLNLLRPEFVMSVGDLIDGYTSDANALDLQWLELESFVGRLEMPFFYVVGNHDISNDLMRAEWGRRRGREYYHFVYRSVLFLCLSTEDPPTESSPESSAALSRFVELARTDPEALRDAMDELEAASEHGIGVGISDAQVEYFRDVLADHSTPRWTFLFMHKPAWLEEHPNFTRIEALLADRPYTAFSGHVHNYSRYERNGRTYIRLGTTGGGWLPFPEGNFDHVTWVTMTPDGPAIANILLEGVLGPAGRTESEQPEEPPPAESEAGDDALLGNNAAELEISDVKRQIERIWREAYQTDFAFQNPGGTRAGLPAGDIRVRQIVSAMPFENTLVILDLTREQVQRVLSDAEFSESKPLYTLVTNSYVGDRFINAYSLPAERIHPLSVSWRTPILEYLEKHGRFGPE